MPKICAPLVENGYESLIREASLFPSLPIDVAEWRADWYHGILEPGILDQVLPALSEALKGLPLLFTFRTRGEGGSLSASLSEYSALLEGAVRSGYVDMVDVELFTGDDTAAEAARLAHQCGVKVIMSSHDFRATPPASELLSRLNRMESLGADIAKIAVTPGCPGDVLTLLSVTEQASRTLSCPVISMSMKGTGLISRLSGEVFGSCLTFGSVREASAPGQIDVKELRTILDIIHKSL